MPPLPSLEKRKLWERSAHAMLTLIPERNPDYFITNPKYIYKDRKGRQRSMLAKIGVRNGEELRTYLEGVISGGDRAQFEQLYSQFVLLTEANRSARIEAESDPELKYKMKVVQKYILRVPMGGIGAFDCSYALFYCFIGRELRWLTRKEKWLYTGRLVNLAQYNYSNWRDYCIGFVIGLEFQSAELADAYVRDRRHRMIKLLSGAHSPMVKTRF